MKISPFPTVEQVWRTQILVRLEPRLEIALSHVSSIQLPMPDAARDAEGRIMKQVVPAGIGGADCGSKSKPIYYHALWRGSVPV